MRPIISKLCGSLSTTYSAPGARRRSRGSSARLGGGPLNHRAMFISLRRLGSMVLDQRITEFLDLDAIARGGAPGLFASPRPGGAPP